MDLYKARLNRTGDNRIDRIKNEQQRNFLKYLERTPNRKTITIENNDYSAAILLKRDQKNNTDLHLLAPYGTPIKTGTLLQWNNASWIVLYEVEPKKTSSFNGVIKKCNNILSWVDTHGVKRESPCYITGYGGENFEQKASLSGWSSNSSFVFPNYNADIDILLPKNMYTAALKNATKFILNETSWMLVNNDSLSSQDLVYLKLKQALKSDVRDDVEGGLADSDRLNSWEIKIVDGEKISLELLEKVPIEAVIYEHGNIVKEPQELVWTVDKEEIIQIEDNAIKALSIGTVLLRIALKNSPEVYDEIQVVVEESPDLNIHYSVNGDSVIKQRETKEYVATRTVNGTEDVDATFRFSLDDPNKITRGLKRTGRNSVLVQGGSIKTGKVTLVVKDDFWTERIEISIESMFA